VSENGSELHERPLGELLIQLAEDSSTLVRKELQLAKAELARTAARTRAGVASFAAAAVALLLALGALTAAAVLALDRLMPAWLGALLVGGAYACVAWALYLRGRERVSRIDAFAPSPIINPFKEEYQWPRTRRSFVKRLKRHVIA
jgi:hypothetical protein